MKLKEWRWSLIATLMINGYLPVRFSFAETICVLMFLWITILFAIYWVEERLENG